MFDVDTVKADFPSLDQQANGHRLVYLDSAATSLKPRAVIERLNKYYSMESANVHRGAHFLAQQGTVNFENSRKRVAQFLGVEDSDTIIFTRGTTESTNLVAESFVRHFLKPGDEILISDVEHHANIVPWQVACQKYELKLNVIETSEQGEITLESVKNMLTKRTKLVAITQASNTLGVIQPIEAIGEIVKKSGAYFFVDGAQYVAYRPVDLKKWNVDFYTFSGHKVFGPTAIGALFGKRELLEAMPPYQTGGSMIDRVDLVEGTTYNEIPYKFEAGTPHIAGAIGLHSALDYFQALDFESMLVHEKKLRQYCIESLEGLGGIHIYSKNTDAVPIVSFNLEGAHHSDVGSLLDQMGIAVRAGHHCTQPLMKKLKITGTVRASFSIYNDLNDVDALVTAVKKAKEMLL